MWRTGKEGSVRGRHVGKDKRQMKRRMGDTEISRMEVKMHTESERERQREREREWCASVKGVWRNGNSSRNHYNV